MATIRDEMPHSMPSPETGEPMYRDVRPVTLEYRGQTTTVDLPGYYPDGDGESVHVGDDLAASDEALRIMKERAGELPPVDRRERIPKSA